MFEIIKFRIVNFFEIIQIKKLKKKYPAWNYENWIDNTEFIWGIKSKDDIMLSDANMYTMNDINITYNHKNKEYILDIETAYSFENNNSLVFYLEGLLKMFSEYMDSENLSKNNTPCFYMSDTTLSCIATDIEGLYGNFRMFVGAWKSILENIKN